MIARTQLQTKIASILSGLGLLAVVALADYLTGYRLTFFLFYLLPILFVLERLGQGYAFGMAVISALLWLAVNVLSGERYPDILTPVWNTGIRLSVFLLVVTLASTRKDLQEQVRQRTASLTQEIQERTRLEKELLETSEREQRRIGHDLHDSLGQQLTATAFAGKVLAKKLTDKALPEAAAADQLVKMVEDGIELTRKLARSLHPVELAADGLSDALHDLAANISKAFNVACRCEVIGVIPLLGPEVNMQFYRIAQEAVSNAIRHGHARNLVIGLAANANEIKVSVADDGGGLPPAARTKRGMGLRIMDYRASMISATFDIQNRAEGGARAVCTLPLISENHGSKN